MRINALRKDLHFDKWKQLTVSTEFFYLKTYEVFLDTGFLLLTILLY